MCNVWTPQELQAAAELCWARSTSCRYFRDTKAEWIQLMLAAEDGTVLGQARDLQCQVTALQSLARQRFHLSPSECIPKHAGTRDCTTELDCRFCAEVAKISRRPVVTV